MCVCELDYEQPDFIDKKTLASRKQHKCDECGAIVEKGDIYERVSGKWGGEIRVYKTCRHCVEIRDEFSERPCFCTAYGSLEEEVCINLSDAAFSPGEKFNYLRLILSHPEVKRRRAASRRG